MEYQNKLLLAEKQNQLNEQRLQTLDSSRESTQNEVIQLKGEIAALKHTYVALDHEKDAIVVCFFCRILKLCAANKLLYFLLRINWIKKQNWHAN